MVQLEQLALRDLLDHLDLRVQLDLSAPQDSQDPLVPLV